MVMIRTCNLCLTQGNSPRNWVTCPVRVNKLNWYLPCSGWWKWCSDGQKISSSYACSLKSRKSNYWQFYVSHGTRLFTVRCSIVTCRWTKISLIIAQMYSILQVIEIVNGDCLMVKTSDGTTNKIFLSSIRPPRFVSWNICFNFSLQCVLKLDWHRILTYSVYILQY